MPYCYSEKLKNLFDELIGENACEDYNFIMSSSNPFFLLKNGVNGIVDETGAVKWQFPIKNLTIVPVKMYSVNIYNDEIDEIEGFIITKDGKEIRCGMIQTDWEHSMTHGTKRWFDLAKEDNLFSTTEEAKPYLMKRLLKQFEVLSEKILELKNDIRELSKQ